MDGGGFARRCSTARALTRLWGSGLGANTYAGGRCAKATAGKNYAGLCCVAGFQPRRTMAAQRRSSGERRPRQIRGLQPTRASLIGKEGRAGAHRGPGVGIAAV